MSRNSPIAFVVTVALAALFLSACNSRSRGRVPGDGSTARDSSTTDGGTDGGGTDGGGTDGGGTDGGGTDSGMTADTGTPPVSCSPTLTISGTGGTPLSGTTTTESDVYAGSCGGNGAPEAVVEWVPGAPGTYQIDTIGSDFDTVLHVRDTGMAPCAGSEIACDDDGGGTGNTSLVTVDVTDASAVLYIFVDGFDTNAGAFVLNIAPFD